MDRGNPFAIARLDLLSFPVAIGARNNHRGRDLAHYKAGLVEVVEILVEDGVLRLYITEKLELSPDLFRIFAEGPLVIVYTRKTRPELWLSLHEVRGPTRSDA